MSVIQVADELEVSSRTVRALIQQRELAAYRISERKTYITRKDLDAFVASRRTMQPRMETPFLS